MPYVQITADERETIVRLHHDGKSQSHIARVLDRSPSTISRELTRNSQEPVLSHQGRPQSTASSTHLSRTLEVQPRPAQDLRDREARAEMVAQADCRIATKTVPERPPHVSLSRNDLCVAQIQQTAGWRCLAELVTGEQEATQTLRTRHIPTLDSWPTPIEQRPLAAENRSRVGDWESDTIEGKKGTGHLVTHVERKTGYVVALQN
ncbi:hypothetical protein KOR42_52100 [Thalassoglobus neptunius]|uniref:Transposase IS30-like HTH domain-containing protein n=1 Tax=Thalassoglobus neptunius TaxID=1938619 RepID=A0A5C5V946_9PLAN|nr:helix-turn-helix domain-containing protein [Thalassoglobus neptunius]TWT35084.1 hypothetical protein KOR42_52100 [Thalassoglobus neptunius]